MDDNTDDDIDNNTDVEDDADDDGQNDSEEIKNIDSDIYSILSPVEKEEKRKKQKDLFSNIYEDADDIIEKISLIVKTDENTEVLSNLIKSLSDIKEYVADYIVNVFDSKTYAENDIVYNKFLVCFKAAENILKELEKNTDNNEEND